ncbi:hypothetical protein M7I_0660 [Glarea lozoyensis 74030]|uniref:Uncharacterized protein n=1 Tax=Glarea lozoyensis (strain ATCC 74030 / MF5533) TaxID=1104152 RepID=H0EDL1_GLAL7|nr:hypothetical protein M7I_0660 [Glarea lozoyensis 74030]
MRSTMPPTTPKTEDDGMSMALVLAMPSETKLFTSLGFQMSTFKVSEYPNQRFYSVHKNLLTQIGGKLKKQAKDLRQSQLIEIPNVDPQIFGFLVDYLYRDTVQTVKIDSNSIEQHTTLTNLCVYYAFLERMQVRYKLLNKVMDSIQDGFCITGTMPDPEFCKSIFANTTPDSQLRKFGVACAAAGFLQSNTTSEQLVAFLKDEEFAYGFLDALRWLDRDVDPRWEDFQVE